MRSRCTSARRKDIKVEREKRKVSHSPKKKKLDARVSEKNTRAAIKAECERFLTKDVLVIVDSMNYIKGYRYELFCIARTVRTPHCVVRTSLFRFLFTPFFFFSQLYCDVPEEDRKIWNEQRENKFPTALYASPHPSPSVRS